MLVAGSGRPDGDWNTRSPPSPSRRASSSAATARADSGTQCSRPAFVRFPGTVHTAPSRSISVQRASRTSPLRQAVSTRSSNASTVPRHASQRRTRASAARTSACGRARWWRGLTAFLGRASEIASPAGLSARWPWATAHFITAPMRWRTRRAVSRLAVQMGSSTVMTSALVTALTVLPPSAGST